MTDLEVKLTADIAELKKKLSDAKKIIAGFGKDVDKEGKRTEQGFRAVGKGAANATPTLQEFSRVIQDAPFGIVGVGNNITQLVSNFGNLQRSAGGTGAALKALLGSLAGPGGFLFAISALVTALTVFGDKLKIAGGLTEDLSKSTAKFTAEAQNEIEVLKGLVRIAEDENQSKKVRDGAIDRINSKYGKYLGNLDSESIKTDAVRSSIDLLTQSLLKQAQVRGIQALIEEKYKDSAEDLVKLQLEQKAAANAIKNEVDKLISSVAAFNKVSREIPLTDQIKQIQSIVNQAGGSGAGRLRVLSNLLGQFDQAVAATKNFTTEFNKELDPLRDILSDATISDLFAEFFDIEEVTVKAGKSVSNLRNTFKNLDDIFGINEAAEKSLNRFRDIQDRFDVTLNGFGDVISFTIKNSVKTATAGLSELERVFLEYRDRYDDIIRTGYATAFAGIGSAIGNALVEGENIGSALGRSLLSTIGGVLTQLGELAISTGVGILAVQTALKSLNPYVAIAAGVALVALGSAFSATTKSIGSGFGGGGGGSIAGQGSQGGRISNNTASFGASVNNNGTVVFKIAGRELVGVLNRELSANSQTGANLTIG